MRTGSRGSIISCVDPRRFPMCHDWWRSRAYPEREAGRKLWDEFERSRPLSEPEPEDEDAEVTLEASDAEPAGAER